MQNHDLLQLEELLSRRELEGVRGHGKWVSEVHDVHGRQGDDERPQDALEEQRIQERQVRAHHVCDPSSHLGDSEDAA